MRTTNSAEHAQKEIQEKLLTEPEQDTIQETLGHGLSGLLRAAQAVGLQNHKGVLDRYLKAVDRATIIGNKAQGIDIEALDKEINPDDEDVDNSVTVAGDTHVHLVAPKVTESPQPTPQPQQPPQAKPGGAPAWLPWVLMAAMGAGGGTYLMTKGDKTIVTGEDTVERTIISLSKGDE